MQKKTDIQNGWDFMAQLMGTDLATQRAFLEYVNTANENTAIANINIHLEQINNAIDELTRNINEHPSLNLGIEQFKGFVAEEFHSGTFNIDAIRKFSDHRTFALHENGYGTVDVGSNFGKSFSFKYANAAKDAENYQAALNPETRMPKYHQQERVIAAEQLDEAKEWAKKRAMKDMYNRPDVAKSHVENSKHLVGQITDDEGVTSQKLSIQESKEIAREAKNGGFDPEKHGIAKEEYLAEVRADYLNQALKAGLTAAAITAITQIVPELYKAIDYLIKHGEIDVKQLKQSGKAILSASGESFLRGSIAFGVQMTLQEGLFGETLKNVNPSIVGAVVSIVLGTIKNSLLVAAGKITAKEMGVKFVDSLFVTSGFLAGGTIGQLLFPELPGIAFALGSLIGCTISVVYNIGKKKLISFCAETGFTCFGLVEQNYQLPDEVLNDMGIGTAKISRSNIAKISVDKVNLSDAVGRTPYETVNLTMLRRGVIGVNTIGYVLE